MMLHGGLIAEDDDLTGVFHRMAPPAFKLMPETVPGEQPLDVTLLAADNTAVCGGLSLGKLLQSCRGCKGC